MKPTIYRFSVALSDLRRDHYDSLNLTIPQHPSETIERMLVRMLVYCLNAEEGLRFSKGLSDASEPALWVHALDGQITSWIEVGEPSPDRVKKATRQARGVAVYCFNTRADVWWEQSRQAFSQLAASVFRFDWQQVQALGPMLKRTMNLSVTISEDALYVSDDEQTRELTIEHLSAK